MKQMTEAISKYTIMGIEFVRLDDLNNLIRVMQRKHREGKEPGYMNQTQDQVLSATGALSHLSVILNKEKNFDGMLLRLFKTRIEREEREAKEESAEQEKPAQKAAEGPTERSKRIPPRYTVWYRDDGETTQHCMGFVRFEHGTPVFTNRPCGVMWFTYRGMAEKVADKLGDGFEVVDMIDQMTPEERLLRAIFREEGMDGEEPNEPEYRGDGTRAEDEA